MTRTKAIEIIDLHLQRPDQVDKHDLDDAIKLGREALKLINCLQVFQPNQFTLRLPGETKE